MSGIWQDLRYGWRTLAAAPGFTLVVILTLALGIGANTVVFTLVNSLFLNSPPGVAEPETLVRVTRTEDDTIAASWSYPDYEALRDRNRSFEAMAAYDPALVAVTMGRPGSTDRVPASVIYVTGEYFRVLRVEPHLGRFFTAEEDRAPREARRAPRPKRWRWRQVPAPLTG